PACTHASPPPVHSYALPRALLSFPTRRSSDLRSRPCGPSAENSVGAGGGPFYGRPMHTPSFVPPGSESPTTLTRERSRLEPLGPQHNAADLAAWSSSIEHIRATPGYPDGSWPPPEGMSLERNLADLERHAADFTARTGFTFTVLDPSDNDVIGCVYIYPAPSPGHDAVVQSWVRATHAELDGPLADAVDEWIAQAWPWENVDHCGR